MSPPTGPAPSGARAGPHCRTPNYLPSDLNGIFLICRSSCFYGTCCLRGMSYSITFLRFCKQVRGPAHPTPMPSPGPTPSQPHSLPPPIPGHTTVLHRETCHGFDHHHPPGFRQIPRWGLQVRGTMSRCLRGRAPPQVPSSSGLLPPLCGL